MPIGVGSAIALGSTLVSMFGSAGSARANKRYDQYLEGRMSDLDKWYNTEYNTPYLDTTAGKSALGSLRTYYGDAMKKVGQNSAITGASDEAKVATGDKVQRGLADSVMRLAGHGTMYRDAIRREYQGMKMGLENLQQQNLANKSANWNTLMSNAANLGITGAELTEGEGMEDIFGYLRKKRGTAANPLAQSILQSNANQATVKNIFNR
jgi:hypothetical protein